MADKNDFDGFAKAIKEVTSDVGALLLDTYIENVGKAGAPQAPLDLGELVTVIQRVKPRLVYLTEDSFDIETATEDLEDGTRSEDEEKIKNGSVAVAVDRLKKKWRKRDGDPCLALAAIVADGVLLTSLSRPAWRDEFDVELEALEDVMRNTQIEEGFALSKRENAEVKEKSVILAKHPTFNLGRTSFEKRMFLAEHLFPDSDPKLLLAITRRADNVDWLGKSGFKP